MKSQPEDPEKTIAQQTKIIYGLVMIIAVLMAALIYGWLVYAETRHQRDLSEGDAIDAQSRIAELEAQLAE